METPGAWLTLVALLCLPLAAEQTVRVDDYGAVGDGVTDDAPAVQRAIAAAGQSATITFTAGKTYRLLTPHPPAGETAGKPGLSVISLEGVNDLTIDGQGAKLSIHPDVQFCFARDCRNLTVRGFEVDCSPQPFVPGTIVAVDPLLHAIDVRIEDGYDVPVADGSELPAHPPFFGWVVATSDQGNIGHYFVRRLTRPSADPRVVRLHARESSFGQFDGRGIVVGSKCSVPVPGAAHLDRRFMQIDGCHDVTVEDLKIWALPYFAFNFSRNTGTVRITNVTLTPRPGTQALTSAGRDGFHCKDNRAQMIFDRCKLAGLLDDCFNISSMTAVPHERVSDRELVVKRTWYPNLGHAEFAAGDLVSLYDEDRKTIFWCERVASAEDFEQGGLKLTRLRFADRPGRWHRTPLPHRIPEQTVVFNQDTASPGAIIRNCDITGSSRMRSSLRIEESTFTGFTWFTAEHVEGPFPRQVMIRNSHFINRDVRNNRGDCLLFKSPGMYTGGLALYRPDGVLLQHNVFDGAVIIEGVAGATLIGNQFNVVNRLKPPGTYESIYLDNKLGGDPWPPTEPTPGPKGALNLMWTYACFIGRRPGDTENRHPSALGPGTVAVGGKALTMSGFHNPSFYALKPPEGGEIGIEFDLDPKYVRLTWNYGMFAAAPPGGLLFYGHHADGSRTLLPIVAAPTAWDLPHVDLTAAPPEFHGRRRVDLVVTTAHADGRSTEIGYLAAWSEP